MTTITVEVHDRIAKKIKSGSIITMDKLYNYDEDIEAWDSVKVGEKASVVLDYLKSIR